MPWYRFRPHKQFGRMNTKKFWELYIKKREEKLPLYKIPPELQEQGIPIEDPNNPDFPYKTTPNPLKIEHPAHFVPEPEDDDHYKGSFNTPCHLFDGSEVLSEGVDQALALSKSLRREGIPGSIMERAKGTQFPGDQEELLRRVAMNANVWDSTMVKMPRRHNEKLFWISYPYGYGTPDWRKNEVLLDDLYRYSFSLVKQHPRLLSQRFYRYGFFNATIPRQEGETVCLRHTAVNTVLAQESLKRILGEEEVRGTRDEPLTDIYPIKPLIDLPEQHIYDNTPLFPFHWQGAKSMNRVHTIFCSREEDGIEAQKYPWTPSEKLGSALLKCFTAALAIARSKYRDELPSVLPDPVVVQLIQVQSGVFDFVVFQLNTLDYSNSDGVRNVAWLDGDNKLYLPKMFYEDFGEVKELNPEVYTKFLSLILNE